MVQRILRIFLGCLLVFSGLIKLYPIEYFENLLITHHFANIQIAPYLARILISLELFLGLGLLSTFFDKIAIRTSIIMLIGYTAWLGYLWLIKGESGNCGCFGDKIIMTPAQATFKNLITLLLLFFLKEKKNAFSTFRFKKVVIVFIVLLSISTPFILTPVIFPEPEIFNLEEQPKLDVSNLSSDSLLIKRLSKGDHIIAFFLSSCDHCLLAAKRIDPFYKENEFDIYAFIYDSPKSGVNEFVAKTQITFPYTPVYSIESLFPMAGNRFPSILVVKNGLIEKRLGFYDLEELIASR